MNKTLLFSMVMDNIADVALGLSPGDTHGPIVKTGPTAGQNRSRNKNGRWRKKRSDANIPRALFSFF